MVITEEYIEKARGNKYIELLTVPRGHLSMSRGVVAAIIDNKANYICAVQEDEDPYVFIRQFSKYLLDRYIFTHHSDAVLVIDYPPSLPLMVDAINMVADCGLNELFEESCLTLNIREIESIDSVRIHFLM